MIDEEFSVQCLRSLKRGCWGLLVLYSMYTISSPPDMVAMEPIRRLTDDKAACE